MKKNREYKVVEDGGIRKVKIGSVEGWEDVINEAKVSQKHHIVLMYDTNVGGPPGMRIGAVLGYDLYIKEKDLERWKSLKGE